MRTEESKHFKQRENSRMLGKQSNISNYFSDKYKICVGACTGKIETLDSSTVLWEMKPLFNHV